MLSEKSLVHEVFMSMANPEQLSFASKKVPENSVWMEDHKLKNLIICHPEVGFYHFHWLDDFVSEVQYGIPYLLVDIT